MHRVGDTTLGARRRALTRFALGNPGSLRRWVVGSLVALIAAGIVAIIIGQTVVFFIPLPLILGWPIYRANLIGDEDELKAEFPRKVVDAIRNPKPIDALVEEPDSDSDDWISTQLEHFEGVPLPPVAEQPDDSVD